MPEQTQLPVPKPEVDIAKMAAEIKTYLDSKKFDLVDYSYVEIECYPPNSEDFPETAKFSKQWQKFLDDADAVLNDVPEEPGETSFKDVLAKYSPNLLVGLEAFDSATNAVAAAVNEDKQYWKTLQEIVLPLYEKSQYYEQWKAERWKGISLSYDPTGLEVKTTQMWTNTRTGERIRGEELRTTEYPAGFVIKVN